MPRIIKGRSVMLDESNVFNPDLPREFNVEKEEIIQETEEESVEERAERIIRKAKSESATILDSAKAEAERIIAEAKDAAVQEVELMFKQSQEKGYSEGYAKGVKESDVLKKKAQNELNSAVAERKKMQTQLEPEIFDLINSILGKIFGESSVINPNIIMYLIKQGLSEGIISGNVIIKVSAADYDRVVENKEAIVSDGSVTLEIIKDSSLSELDCIIETPYGNIDASLGHQFETLKGHLKFIFDNR